MKHSSVEAQAPAHPPQSTFNTEEAERLTACAERASHDQSNSIETSRLLKNVSRMLYCALVETAQRAKVRLASVIALDRISQRLRRFDQEADVEEMLADTVASVTLMANANDTDDPIEHKRQEHRKLAARTTCGRSATARHACLSSGSRHGSRSSITSQWLKSARSNRVCARIRGCAFCESCLRQRARVTRCYRRFRANTFTICSVTMLSAE